MDWGSIILGAMTIAGTLFGAISIYDARKSKRELEKYTYLFDLAEKNIDKTLTLEEINRLHEEKRAMDKIIKEEIPRQARITVLYDRLKADEEYLSSSYHRYKQTQKEYDKLQQEEKIEIPNNILNEIEHQILPNYLIKEQKQKFMSMLTTISYATAFLSVIPVFMGLSRYSIFFTAYPLIRIIGLDMPKGKQERKRYVIKILHNAFLIISLLVSIYLGLLAYEQYCSRGWIGDDAEIVLPLSISLLLFLLLFISKIMSIDKSKREKK